MVTSLPPTVQSHSNFIDGLVQANMQPIVQQLQDMDSFIESLRPAITRVARSLYCSYVDVEDMVQEGMIGVWKTAEKHGTDNTESFYLTAARWSMLKLINKDASTDVHMDDMGWLAAPAAQPATHREISSDEIKLVNKAMRRAKLSKRARWVVRAELQYYKTNLPNGAHVTRHSVQRRYNMNNGAYETMLRHSIKRIQQAHIPM